MSNNRPTHRIVAKDKNGKRYEVGAIFAPRSERAPDGLLGSLVPCTESKDGQYPRMSLADALELHARREVFLDIWTTERRSDDGDAVRTLRSGKPLVATGRTVRDEFTRRENDGFGGDDGGELPF
jgi:hypothetical protein